MKKGSTNLLLLDVNVLLAVAWPNHQFHAAAKRRLERSLDRWATCAITELGFVRLSSNPAAIPTAKSPQEAVSLLAAMVSDPLHVYFPSLPSLVAKNARPQFANLFGTKQIMDAYLLWLARRHHAIFVTFDTRLRALAGSQRDVEILG
jgi:toxin-antitoxin system PIN domain toxin